MENENIEIMEEVVENTGSSKKALTYMGIGGLVVAGCYAAYRFAIKPIAQKLKARREEKMLKLQSPNYVEEND